MSDLCGLRLNNGLLSSLPHKAGMQKSKILVAISGLAMLCACGGGDAAGGATQIPTQTSAATVTIPENAEAGDAAGATPVNRGQGDVQLPSASVGTPVNIPAGSNGQGGNSAVPAAGQDPCTYQPGAVWPGQVSDSLAPRPGSKGWDERYRGKSQNLDGAELIHCETFATQLSLQGPTLWAKNRADFGASKFDAAGGRAYSINDGVLSITAYQDGAVMRSGLVQSLSSAQAYNGATILSGTQGFICTGCFWEARIRFPKSWGTWGAFWLLSPDAPGNRGHLEVDGIEYYGEGDARGHHHGVHRWKNGTASGSYGDYTGMDEIADGGWHTYGIDLRGLSTLDGKPALVMYFDGREVGRLAADADYFSTPFYYLLNLAINGKSPQKTFPQTMDVDYVRVFQRKS
ncbi:glycoside hydrolase family 16 protein [Sphingobium phenoxybenzoativorans]|uniref:Glycoside hydrolase family 16 protein n=1 Tax=Sphingobium phenoxybenzoativorans TaxID=1592790 RepID=A0A975K7S0_9SPHN|nr:glycoside hydrolase family 16 protein [Sphingobium phenoxybenzoativorans]QUT05643.1 glycoside hydrolase family 16 protein [Sphingobium phenoxybenzoativorans]